MSAGIDPYAVLAKYYDGAYAAMKDLIDVPFYAPNSIVRRYYRKDAVHKIHQIYTVTFLLRTYEGEDLIREESESLSLSYYTYPHLRALFMLTGLDVVEEYGSFGKAPLDNSATDMIFLLQRLLPSAVVTQWRSVQGGLCRTWASIVQCRMAAFSARLAPLWQPVWRIFSAPAVLPSLVAFPASSVPSGAFGM
jgi:hypothetical protein